MCCDSRLSVNIYEARNRKNVSLHDPSATLVSAVTRYYVVSKAVVY